MQEKKTPAFRTKVLNMTVPRVIPEDVMEHLWVGGDRESETNYIHTRPTAISLWDVPLRVKQHAEEPPSIFAASLSLCQGAVVPVANGSTLQAPAFSSILLSVSETRTCVLYFKIHLCHRLSVIFEGWAKFKKNDF